MTVVSRLRFASRLLVLDESNRLLLIHAILPDAEYWGTPGGGLESQETFEAAALRELHEETGIAVPELGPCVWIKNKPGGQPGFRAEEHYFVVRIEAPILTEEYMDDAERLTFREFRWWTIEEIQSVAVNQFIPRELPLLLPAILAGEYPSPPVSIVV
jgi:ADP-ribose pyrophosphatase YjhB (NUDIX family)